MADLEPMVAELEAAGYTVCPPPPEPVYPTCAHCDTKSNEDYMSSVSVTTNEGEEGYDTRTLLYCEAHADELREVLDFLTSHGYATHYHGSTMMLTDPNCPATTAGECPTPEDSPYEREEPRL